MSIEALLSRLDGPRPNGRDRWRCACPVCGGKNKSTLSIGIGDTGAVLLKCFKFGCAPEAIASAVGLDITELFPPKESSSGPLRRRRMLSDRQALELLAHESLLTWTAAQNLANGHSLTPSDLERLNAAVKRIQDVQREVRQ